MIMGCSQVENPSKESIFLFKKLNERGYPGLNSFTLAFVLKACSIVSALEEGRQVHSRVFRSGFGSSPFVQTALVNMYAKCEEVSLAQLVFDEITERNLIAWSTLIGGYSRAGLVDETFELFRGMQMAGVEPDQVTMVSVVSACTFAGSLDMSRWFMLIWRSG
ncbi:Pentatricopeptide repeat [Parasponia andersonii]|uniref:Pentatricopeptide repeat n=1 Tax=Parasponia andersonii TaxID=3476 RepID=A0A2P5A7I2_PARAD|nr:Pentatricopeptide repeat [Parasponia andersonii]